MLQILRQPVGAALASFATDVVPLSCVDDEAVAQCLEVLGPLATGTTELSLEKKVCASKEIPIILNDLQQNNGKFQIHKPSLHMAAYSKSVAFLMACCGTENVGVVAMANVLDPRFKTLAFGNQTYAQDAVVRVTAECAGLR